MRKVVLSFAIVTLAVVCFAPWASAEDVLYITRPTIMEAPQALPRYDCALWNMDFRENPALLNLDCPYEFIYDTYYLGGYRGISSSARGGLNFGGAVNPFSTRSSEMDYYAHALGADVGLTLKLNDRANLAAIFGYRWDHVSGDGSLFDYWERITAAASGAYGYFDGSIDENFNGHTFGGSILLSSVMSDRFTFGAGLKYSYTFEKYESDLSGLGARIPFPAGTPHYENVSAERTLTLKYHRLAPVLGVSLKPAAWLALDASVEAGVYVGTVHKDSVLFDDYRTVGIPAEFPVIPTSLDTYTEDLDSSDLYGWDIAAQINPEIVVSDALSIPLAVAYNYRNFRWGVGGLSTGYFATYNLLDVSLGPGTVNYDNTETSWDIIAEAGVKYRAGWGTLSGLIGYTHRDLRNGYDLKNQVQSPIVGPTNQYNGLAIYTRRDEEKRDILSLGIVYEKEFSPALSADFGARYDLGWGYRKVNSTLTSRFELAPPVTPTLAITTDGRDIYQDLTLTTHITLKPTERLSIALGGMVKIPLDTLDYDMDGAATGLTNIRAGVTRRPGYFFDGPFSMGYESSGWDWGGLLSVTYEFGCPVAVPPAPAPVIEPKIEPMSFK